MARRRRELTPWTEVIGRLTSVEDVDRRKLLTIGDERVLIGSDVSEEKLRQAVGNEISILRTETGYFIRVEGDQ